METPIIGVIDPLELILASEGWGGSGEANALAYVISEIAQDEAVLHSPLKHTLLLISADDVSARHPALRRETNGVYSVAIGLPGEQSRKSLITTSAEKGKLKLSEDQLDEAIRNSAGCTLRSIRRFMNTAVDEKDPKSVGATLMQYRKEFISKEAGGILVIDEPRYGREVIGGLDYVFDLLDREIYPFLKKQNPLTPSGVLFMGPPGTGKSVTAEAIAYECNLPFVTMRLENVFHWFVGSSERNMDKAINIIKSVSPCVVWMDEIDQIGMQRGSYQGDSGVSARIFKRLLEFLGDDNNHGRVVFLAASNEPTLIDAAMRRSGRFDLKIPFIPGDGAMRAQIVDALITKYASTMVSAGLKPKVDSLKVAEATPKLLGSDLELLLTVSMRATVAEGKKTLTTDTIIGQVDFVRPSITNEDKQRYIREALQECNVLTYLPDSFIELARSFGQKTM
jgi:SpoVK/Ycf46/Vps4 family AAA+-type ATPase